MCRGVAAQRRTFESGPPHGPPRFHENRINRRSGGLALKPESGAEADRRADKQQKHGGESRTQHQALNWSIRAVTLDRLVCLCGRVWRELDVLRDVTALG